MNTIDLVWSRRPDVADVLRKTSAEGDSFFSPFRDMAKSVIPGYGSTQNQPAAPPAAPPAVEPPKAVAPPAPPPPAPPTDPAGIAAGTPSIVPPTQPAAAAEAAKNVAAPFHGQIENIVSGKESFLDLKDLSVRQLDTTDVDQFIKDRNYNALNLPKYLPSKDLDKLSPEQLGQAQRAWLLLSQNEKLAPVMNERIFDNPDGSDLKMTAKEVGGLYQTQFKKLDEGKRPAYGKALHAHTGEEKLTEWSVTSKIREALPAAQAKNQAALKEVETNPKGTGFTDWFTESWGNVAVPAGMLLMLFGGDTGMMLGGLAIAAGGYDIYNRYNTLTKDPIAQTAIEQFVDGKFSQEALAGIRQNLGDKYAKSALDFMALSRYGFLSVVQNKYRNAGMDAYRSLVPSATDKDMEAYKETLPGATPDTNTLLQDWSGKGGKVVSDLWNQGMSWLPGTPAAAK